MPTQQGLVADPASRGMLVESSGPVKHAHRDLELPPPNKQKALPAGASDVPEMLHAGTNPAQRVSCTRGKPSSAVSSSMGGKPETGEAGSLRAAAGIAAAPSPAALGSSHKAVKRTAAAVALSDDQDVDALSGLTAPPTSRAAPPAAVAATPGVGNPCWKSALLYGTAAAAVVAVTSPLAVTSPAEALPVAISSQPGASKPPGLPSSNNGATQPAANPAAPSSTTHVAPPRAPRAVRVRHVRAGPPAATTVAAARPLLGPSITTAAAPGAPRAMSPPPPSPAAAPAAHPSISGSSSPSSSGSEGPREQQQRRVRFARGHLDPTSDPTAAPDGHPATEGCQVAPVRHLPQSYALDLTRGNVLMLEQMLGDACRPSISRLKRRVGLLPPIRAPRPYLCSRPLPQPISSTPVSPPPAAAAAAGGLGNGNSNSSSSPPPSSPQPLGTSSGSSSSGTGTHSSSPRCKHTVSRVGASRGAGAPVAPDGVLLRDQA